MKNEIKKMKVSKEILEQYVENARTMSVEELMKRPDITKDVLFEVCPNLKDINGDVFEEVSIDVKYEGYIVKTYKDAEKLIKLESKQIPDDIDYGKVYNLASEARQKLEAIRPRTIAQASRISGVNPADISILAVYLRKEYGKNE